MSQPLPTFDHFIFPLLQILAAQTEPLQASACYAAVAARMNLTPEQLAAQLPSQTQPVYSNRIGWAHNRLKTFSYSTSPRRGYWLLNDAGRAYAKQYASGLPDSERLRLAYPKAVDRTRLDSTGVDVEAQDVVLTPQERLDAAFVELQDEAARALLERIGQSSPVFFERLVLDLLHALGYGGSRDALQRVGGSGDGGIDGIVSLDRLGFEKVYVQAKRWQANVGIAEVQAFFGALAGRKAKKGVFITTSSYTRDALGFGAQVSDSVVLIDGQRLTALMLEAGVGVSHYRTLKLARIDDDYFEDE